LVIETINNNSDLFVYYYTEAKPGEFQQLLAVMPERPALPPIAAVATTLSNSTATEASQTTPTSDEQIATAEALAATASAAASQTAAAQAQPPTPTNTPRPRPTATRTSSPPLLSIAVQKTPGGGKNLKCINVHVVFAGGYSGD